MTSKSKVQLPTTEGAYWAGLDDGNGNVEIALLRLEYYLDATNFDDGCMAYFVDGTGRRLELKMREGEIAQPRADSSIAFIPMTAKFSEVKITWHGAPKPPLSARRQQPERSHFE